MALNYERIGWENAPSTNTPIDAGSLNHMDNGILAVSNLYDVDVPYLKEQVAGIPAMLDSYLADQIGVDVGKWLNDHVTPGGSTIVVDNTLTISGAAADSKTVGDAVDQLKNALNYSVDVSTLNWVIGSIQGEDGQEFDSTTRIRSDFVYVSEGTKVKLTGNGYCLSIIKYDNDKNFIDAIGFSSVINNSYTVTNGVSYIRILIRVSTSNETITSADVETQYSRCSIDLCLDQAVYTLPEVVDGLSYKIDEIEELTTEDITKISNVSMTWTDGGYLDSHGVVNESSSYSYSNYIEVQGGDILSGNMRFTTAYDSSKNALSSYFASEAMVYTVNPAVSYVRVSRSKSLKGQPLLLQRTTKQNSAFSFINGLETTRNGATGIKKTGNLTDSTLEFNAYAAIRKGKTYSLYGKVSAFNKLTIGCGTSDSVNGARIEIDTTNVKFLNSSAVINTTAHGLTFLNYIYVIIDIDENAFPKVTIYTDGGNFQKTYADEWIGASERTYATADASTSLTSCIFTFSAASVKKNIWYCGDSYMAVRDSGKLPSKLKYFDVFKNINSIGYSGAGSENVLPYLLNMFNMDLYPKYIVWAIGMNNGDASNAVNTTWKSGYDTLVGLAGGGQFELILATIPNTPTINNNYKNAIVRNSGYRYIDFADAVQTSEGASTWLTGMLSNDNVHPTAEGAKALASRLCADFPEIFN